eukprot:gene11288-855_t
MPSDADDEMTREERRRDKARRKKKRKRTEMSDSKREAAKDAARLRMQRHREKMSEVKREAAKAASRQRMAKPRNQQRDRQRKATPVGRAASRRRKSAPAAKDATRRRMAEPRNLGKDRKRKAQPEVMAKTRERVAKPSNREAHSRWKAGKAALCVGEPLGDRRLCPLCGAAVWKAEGDRCCGGGKHVARRPPPPPAELLRWTGEPALNPWTSPLQGKTLLWDTRRVAAENAVFAGLFAQKDFSAGSRRVNNHVAFSAIGTDMGKKRRADEAPVKKADGKGKKDPPSMVRLAGRVYHYIPSADDPRSTIPYYVNDAMPSVAQPSDEAWVRTVHAVLMRTHPLARTLRAAREIRAREVRVVPAPYQRKPECAAEISARYRINTDADDAPDRHFIVFHRDGGIQLYPTLAHELYESLQYPLLYPHGTVGWWARTGQMYECAAGRPMTLMWYARQRMFCEPTLHVCGRLFNEWLVDTFCRMDDMRLQYMASREGQKKLRLAEKDDVEHYCDDIEAGVGAGSEKPGR